MSGRPVVVILAGGLGTRLAEETELRPKPMIEIGGRPILWHIMKHYAHHGFKEFVIALGYKGEVIKRFFLDYQQLSGNMTVEMRSGKSTLSSQQDEDWVVHLVDTGPATNTGGRIKRVASLLGGRTFLVTYGDGVCDVDPHRVLELHKKQGAVATLTAVRPVARFGRIDFDGDNVKGFAEKPQAGEGWINGGFIACEPALLDLIEGDQSSLESEALERASEQGKLCAFRHEGFWQCMDTLRDKRQLEAIWESGKVPWKTWA